jgi:hypothetical protein
MYLSDDEAWGLPKVSEKALKRVSEKAKKLQPVCCKIMEHNASDVLNNIAKTSSGRFGKCLKRSGEEV